MTKRESEIESIANLIRLIHATRIEVLHHKVEQIGGTFTPPERPDFRVLAETHLDAEIAKVAGAAIRERLNRQLLELQA